MATVYCVYRHRHSGLVRSLTAPALAAGWSVHLWALDRPADELAGHTRGDGPGWKLDLLNGLMAAHPPAEGSVVLSDDDVELPYGDVVALERTCRTADLDLAMPAHARDSNASYPFTLARRYRRVRLTSYVESGPMLVVGPAGRDRFLPLPAGLEMGWGVELAWTAEVARGPGSVSSTPCRCATWGACPPTTTGPGRRPTSTPGWRPPASRRCGRRCGPTARGGAGSRVPLGSTARCWTGRARERAPAVDAGGRS